MDKIISGAIIVITGADRNKMIPTYRAMTIELNAQVMTLNTKLRALSRSVIISFTRTPCALSSINESLD